MENVRGGKITRRAFMGAAAAGAAACAAGALSGCKSESTEEQIASLNEKLASQIDYDATRIPLGSVVETSLGRFMICGHKFVSRTDDRDPSAVRYWDYVGAYWPAGTMAYPLSALNMALLLNEDIEKILFVGYVNEEDSDYRYYMVDNHKIEQTVARADASTLASNAGYAFHSEQLLRASGKRSAELYGDDFNGGLLCEGFDLLTKVKGSAV